MLNAWRRWCRLCGKQQSDVDVFIHIETVIDISEAIEKYFSIKITSSDEMPTVICTKCHTYMLSVMQFAERCIKMDAMFSQLAHGDIKLEDEDIEKLRYHYGVEKDDFTVYEPLCDIEFGSVDDSSVDATYLQEECGTEEESEDDGEYVEKEKAKKKRRRPKATPLDDSVKCEICERVFVRKAGLRQHLKNVHGTRERPFICEVCGKTFMKRGGLTEHMCTHMEETPFHCSHCPKKFKNMSQLKKHADTHNDTTYVCPDCGLQLNTKRTLQMHRVVHSDQKKFKCQFCGNEYKRAKALKNHLILHTGLKPYSCPFCDRTFANGSNCRSHKKKAHPVELAAMEAAGEVHHAANIPKIEQLKAAVTNKEPEESNEIPTEVEITISDIKP